MKFTTKSAIDRIKRTGGRVESGFRIKHSHAGLKVLSAIDYLEHYEGYFFAKAMPRIRKEKREETKHESLPNIKASNFPDCNRCATFQKCRGVSNPIGCTDFVNPDGKWMLAELALNYPSSLNEALSSLPFDSSLNFYLPKS